MSFRAISVLAGFAIAACSPNPENSGTYVVRTEADAIAIAKTTWAGLDLRDRPLKAGLDGDKWIVQRAWKEGDQTEEAVIIDALTGKAERSSIGVLTIHFDQR